MNLIEWQKLLKKLVNKKPIPMSDLIYFFNEAINQAGREGFQKGMDFQNKNKGNEKNMNYYCVKCKKVKKVLHSEIREFKDGIKRRVARCPECDTFMIGRTDLD